MICVPLGAVVNRNRPAASVRVVWPASVRVTPSSGASSCARSTRPAKVVVPAAKMENCSVAVRVTVWPSIVVLPVTVSGIGPAGVVALVVSVSVTGCAVDNTGALSLAVTPVVRPPTARFTRLAKPGVPESCSNARAAWPWTAVTASGAVAIWKSADSVTVKGALLIAVPVGVVTVIGPVMAPWGTVVVIDVVVAEAMTAATPLKRT